MKKLIATLVLAMTPVLFWGQSVFDKYDGAEETTIVTVNKKMFEMIGNVKTNDKNSQQYIKLIKTLDNLRVVSSSDAKTQADMKATVTQYLASKKLEELMRVSDSGNNIKIYINSGGNTTQVKELLMFIENKGVEESVIVSLTGNFDLNNISSLVDKMNFPGGEHLKKASQK